MGNPGPPYGQYPGSDPTRPQQPGWTPPPGPSPYQQYSQPQQQPTWGYQPPEPPRRSNTGLIIALAIGGVVLLLAVIVVAVVVTDKSGPKTAASTTSAAPSSGSATDSATAPAGSRTLIIPTTVSGYTRNTGNVADRLTTTMRESMAKASPQNTEAFAKARLGLYSKGDQQLIYVGLRGSDSPSFASELAAKSPSDEVDSMFVGAGVTNTADYPAGPLGGTLRCGNGNSGGVTMSLCAWADSSVAAIIFAPGMTSTSDLAPITLAFRTAAEQ